MCHPPNRLKYLACAVLLAILVVAGWYQNYCHRRRIDEMIVAAARKDDIATIDRLLLAGADGDSADRYPDPRPLWTKIVEMIRLPRVPESRADTALMMIMNPHERNERTVSLVPVDSEFACSLLIECGAEIDKRDSYGDTALIYAVTGKLNKCARSLLDHGASPNMRDNDGFTALMFASSLGDYEMAQMLIHYGADVNCVSDYGNTALTLAQCQFQSDNSNAALVQLLKSAAKSSTYVQSSISSHNPNSIR